MKQYHNHLEAILKYGTPKAPAREGLPGSLSLFGYQNEYDLSEGFPILTTKKIPFRWVVEELLWFLRGDTNIKYLDERGIDKMWHEDAYNYYEKLFKPTGDILLSFEDFCRNVKHAKSTNDLERWSPAYPDYILGDCGKQYGWLWRNWSLEKEVSSAPVENDYITIDQIKNLIEGLKKNPEGRRHIVTAWNPATLDDMALHACHSFVQFNCRQLNLAERLIETNVEYVGGGKDDEEIHKDLDALGTARYYLDCKMFQRSADMFLGVPFNISSYALLTHIIAKICNMVPGRFIHTFGDSHIYDNHMDQVKEILSRDPEKHNLPKLHISDMGNDWAFIRSSLDFGILTSSDFSLEGYESYPHIPAPLSTGLKK